MNLFEMKNITKLFLTTILLIVVVGCSSTQDVYVSLGKDDLKAYEKEYVDSVKKIAIIPFSNNTEVKNASRIVMSAYITVLHESDRYVVEEPGNIRSFIISEQIQTVGDVDLERAMLLGRRLKLDGVLVGTVSSFSFVSTEMGKIPELDMSVRMVDPKTGDIVWAARSFKNGDDYVKIFEIGKVRTMSSLAKIMAGELVDNLYW